MGYPVGVIRLTQRRVFSVPPICRVEMNLGGE